MDTMLDFDSKKATTGAEGIPSSSPGGSNAAPGSAPSPLRRASRTTNGASLNHLGPVHGAGAFRAGSSHSLLGADHEPRSPPTLTGNELHGAGPSFLDSGLAEMQPLEFLAERAHVAEPLALPRPGSDDGRFACLLNVSEELTLDLEREEKRKARTIWRNKTDMWGKLLMPIRKKAHNEPSYYDSEDSDYETPAPISDDTALNRMLSIDATITGLKNANPASLKREMMRIAKSSKRWATVLIKQHKDSRKAAPCTPDHHAAPSATARRQHKPITRPDSIYDQPITQHKRPYTKAETPDCLSELQPRKRDSKPLDSYCMEEEDGTLRCLGCNKGDFATRKAFRSHLSHCSAKRAERKAAHGLGTGALGREEFRFDRDTRLPALPRRRPAAQDDEDLHSGAPSTRPSVPLGVPLVPHSFSHGIALVGSTVSFREAEGTAWEEARLHRYNDRTNSHMVQLRKGRVVWTTLTTYNCRLPRHQGQQQQEARVHGSPSSAVPVPRHTTRGDGGVSIKGGDDTRSSSSGDLWRQYDEQLPKSGGKRKAGYPATSMDQALEISEDEDAPPTKRRTGGLLLRPASEAERLQQALMGGAHNTTNSFQGGGFNSCLGCDAVFPNKQRLGWHTRRGECPASQNYQPPSPAMDFPAPQEQQPPMSGPSGHEGETSSMEVERSAFTSQKRGAQDITPATSRANEEEEAPTSKRTRRG